MHLKQQQINRTKKTSLFFYHMTLISGLLFFCNQILFAEGKNNSEEQLLDQYIHAKGTGTIVFDASNIKQFWIDKSVVSLRDHFEIIIDPETSKSIPLKIQLMNTKETMDCKVDVISQDDGFSFSVLNSSKKNLSNSKNEDDFIQYKVQSSLFHLEDADDNSFSLVFNSLKSKTLKIKSIILSFPDNPHSYFLSSPGSFILSDNNIILGPEWDPAQAKQENDNTFSVNGKKSSILSKNNIYVSDHPVTISGTIKNTGAVPTQIYVGYAAYSKNREWINHKNYPYSPTSRILKIISAAKGEEKIVVDSYDSQWTKGSYLALNAKADLSDIPNTTFADGTIVEIKEMDNGQAEIIMNKPLHAELKEGTEVRINGGSGAYLYANSKVLQPGDEIFISHSITRNEDAVRYSKDALAKGMYFVKIVILSYSVDSNEINTISISNFSVSY